MSDELVKRLRLAPLLADYPDGHIALLDEAAGTIERLQAELAEARTREREACAKVADDLAVVWVKGGFVPRAAAAAGAIARTIRERTTHD